MVASSSTPSDFQSVDYKANMRAQLKNEKNDRVLLQSKLLELQQNLKNGGSMVDAQNQLKELIDLTGS